MTRAFTLIELLVVIAIMGFMGTISVAAYRSMRIGMEERGVMQNVDQFVRNAYQRSRIDQVPVAIYFWNETKSEDKDEDTVRVCGHAVAVRRAGRLSAVEEGNYLVDEFGDLAELRQKNREGEDEDDSTDYQEDPGRWIYRINGNESGFHRARVSQITQIRPQNVQPMISAGTWSESQTDLGKQIGAKAIAYAYYLLNQGSDITDWRVGDAYGFEFAEIELPAGYMFGGQYASDASDPVKPMSGRNPVRFDPSGSDDSGTIDIYALRPNASGALTAQRIATSSSPKTQMGN